MTSIALSYSGALANNNAIDMYDAARGLAGFHRSLALTTHLMLNGEIITCGSASKWDPFPARDRCMETFNKPQLGRGPDRCRSEPFRSRFCYMGSSLLWIHRGPASALINTLDTTIRRQIWLERYKP